MQGAEHSHFASPRFSLLYILNPLDAVASVILLYLKYHQVLWLS